MKIFAGLKKKCVPLQCAIKKKAHIHKFKFNN